MTDDDSSGGIGTSVRPHSPQNWSDPKSTARRNRGSLIRSLAISESRFRSVDQQQHTPRVNRCVNFHIHDGSKPQENVSRNVDQPPQQQFFRLVTKQRVLASTCKTEYSVRSCPQDGNAETRTGGEPIRQACSEARDSTRNSVESNQPHANLPQQIRQQAQRRSGQRQSPSQCEWQRRPDTRHTNLRRVAAGLERNPRGNCQSLPRVWNNDRSDAMTR